jgi:hypothetical protein
MSPQPFTHRRDLAGARAFVARLPAFMRAETPRRYHDNRSQDGHAVRWTVGNPTETEGFSPRPLVVAMSGEQR